MKRLFSDNDTCSSKLQVATYALAEQKPFDVKLVSVKLTAFGFVLPTLSLGFWKSFFFSFFFRALAPIL